MKGEFLRHEDTRKQNRLIEELCFDVLSGVILLGRCL